MFPLIRAFFDDFLHLALTVTVIIEVKPVRKGETLDEQCDLALAQIEEKQYALHLDFENYKKITKYGIAFQEKQCMVKKA